MSALALVTPRKSVACEVAEPSLDHRALWCAREACRRVIGKQEAAARAFGKSPGHFSRQLSGLDPLPLTQLATVPEVFIEFAALLAKACGHRLATRATAAQRRRHQAMRLQLLDLTRLVLDAEDDEDPGAFAPFAT